jgi:hypothetical protein
MHGHARAGDRQRPSKDRAPSRTRPGESPADRVLALQRSAGNRAVVRVLARNGPVATMSTPKQMFEGDVAAKKWDRAVQALQNLDKKQIGPALGFLTPEQLRYLDDAATRASSKTSTSIREALQTKGATKQQAKPGRAFGKASAKYGKIKSGKKSDKSYEVPIELTFKPDPAAVGADEITWIQTVRTVDTPAGTLNEPRAEFTARATPSSWMLDRLEGRKFGWYGFADDETTLGNVRPWAKSNPTQAAWMSDAPGWNVPDMKWEFEAAAVCRKGSADTSTRKGDKPGFVYAVVTWGFDVGHNGEVKTHKIKVWNKPTTDFVAAVDQWNAQARDELAVMNAPDQEELPAIQ